MAYVTRLLLAIFIGLASACSADRHLSALPPQDRQTSSIGASAVGRLVRVRGRLQGDVIDDRPWGWKLFIDDGSGPVLVFVDSKTGIDVTRFRDGQQIEATGVGGQFEQHFEILPRTQSDLQIVPAP